MEVTCPKSLEEKPVLTPLNWVWLKLLKVSARNSRRLPRASLKVKLLNSFDVFKEAHGGGRGVTWTAHGLEPDALGKLNIALAPIRNYACVNAVEVLDESK